MNSTFSLFAFTFILTSQNLTLLGEDTTISKQSEIIISRIKNPISIIALTEDKAMASHISINLKERRVYVYQNSEVIKSYKVAIGKKGWETP